MEKTKKTCLMSVKVTYPVSLNQMAYMFLVPSDSVAFPDSSCPQIPLHLSGPGNLCRGKKQDIKMGVLIYPPLVVPAEVRNEFTVCLPTVKLKRTENCTFRLFYSRPLSYWLSVIYLP